MNDLLYFILSSILILGILIGIVLMSKVDTSVKGNKLSAVCTAGAVILTLLEYKIFSALELWIVLIIGFICSIAWAYRVKMIEMPEVVAILNGFGGAASALVVIVSMIEADNTPMTTFGFATGGLALAVGMTTLTGSLVAAGKLHKIISQKPIIWKRHQIINVSTLLLTLVSVVVITRQDDLLIWGILACTLISGFFGIAFAIRVGGADMPITISLLNSLSGVAGAISGMAINNPFVVAVGGIVGASGLLLTQIMCKSMNRQLSNILTGKTSMNSYSGLKSPLDLPKLHIDPSAPHESLDMQTDGNILLDDTEQLPNLRLEDVLKQSKQVIIIPGYGMAIAQAQQNVKQLSDKLEENGATVNFAIHPVAGRMPGHMNVLLAEADVPYDKLFEMDDINPKFEECDLAIIIGANDVVNPAANTAKGTPIYGMPVLNAEKAKHLIICNYDLKPGYSGVDNPLYTRSNVTMLLGNAAETLKTIINLF